MTTRYSGEQGPLLVRRRGPRPGRRDVLRTRGHAVLMATIRRRTRSAVDQCGRPASHILAEAGERGTLFHDMVDSNDLTLSTVLRAARALRVSFAWLLGLEGEDTQAPFSDGERDKLTRVTR